MTLVPALLFSILTHLFLSSSSVSLSYFVLAVPMRACLGNMRQHIHILSKCYKLVLKHILYVSERVSSILKKYDKHVCHKPSNKLRNHLCNFKDRREPSNEAGVVYKLCCNDCSAVYIIMRVLSINCVVMTSAVYIIKRVLSINCVVMTVRLYTSEKLAD